MKVSPPGTQLFNFKNIRKDFPEPMSEIIIKESQIIGTFLFTSVDKNCLRKNNIIDTVL